MKNQLSKVKFHTINAWNGFIDYTADILNAIIGQTRKQSNFLEVLLDRSISSISRLTAENRSLKKRIAELESNVCCKETTKKKVAKVRPNKTK